MIKASKALSIAALSLLVLTISVNKIKAASYENVDQLVAQHNCNYLGYLEGNKPPSFITATSTKDYQVQISWGNASTTWPNSNVIFHRIRVFQDNIPIQTVGRSIGAGNSVVIDLPTTYGAKFIFDVDAIFYNPDFPVGNCSSSVTIPSNQIQNPAMPQPQTPAQVEPTPTVTATTTSPNTTATTIPQTTTKEPEITEQKPTETDNDTSKEVVTQESNPQTSQQDTTITDETITNTTIILASILALIAIVTYVAIEDYKKTKLKTRELTTKTTNSASKTKKSNRKRKKQNV